MNSRVFAVSLLLFGSGLCALVYQTVWLREFRLIFGASTAATAAVLGIFMGGLGVGSVLLGNRVERTRKPLNFYANLEFAIAIAAALTPFLVDVVRWSYSAAGGSQGLGGFWGTCARLLLSAVVLVVPTVLMGGTLPALARSVTSREDAGRRALAWLYGVNTIGAVTGAMLATFVVLEVFGNRMTLWMACMVNLVVAVVARGMGRNENVEHAKEEEVETVKSEAAAPAGFVLLAAAVAGFAFLLMELVWYRMLSPLLGGSTFTFGLILAVALLGIGLGGGLYAVAGRKAGGTLSSFGWTCALEALLIAVPFALGDRLAILAAHLRSLSSLGFAPHLLGWAVIIAIVVLPAAIVAGFQFPLLVALLGRGGNNVGRHVARTYALNTAGSITGSLAGGFGLLPLLSAPGAWKLVVFVLVALAMGAVIIGWRRSGGRVSRLGVVFACVAACFLMLVPMGPTAVWRHSGVGVGRSGLTTDSVNRTREVINSWQRRVIWEAEGVESSVAIAAGHGASFVVNGKSDGNIRVDAGTQVLGGLIGAALMDQVKTACVIGLGTGCTAGWLADVPEIERVDAMELEPAILHIAKVCELGNRRVLENKKCRVLLGDAREMLLTSKERYDLVFSEPSNPYRAGIASLFTTEFYETAKQRLNPGGLFVQWVQAYEIDSYAMKMVFATLGGVFPQVEAWTTQYGDMLLVASAEPRQWSMETIRKRCAQEPFRTAMQRVWGTDSAEGFLAHFVAGASVARRIAADPEQPRNTDDNTLLEFAFARSVGKSGGFRTPELVAFASTTDAKRPSIVGEVDWAKVREEQVALYLYDGHTLPLDPSFPEEIKNRQEARRLSLGGDYKSAAKLILEKNIAPMHSRDTLTFAHALADAGAEEARALIEKIRTFSPGEADTLAALLAFRKKDYAATRAGIVSAMTHFQTDAWPLVEIQTRAYDLASELSVVDPSSNAVLFEAVKPVLPGYLAENRRRMTLVWLSLQMSKSGTRPNFDVYGEFGIPQWTQEFLRDRFAYFSATKDPRTDDAAIDLAEFLNADPTPFGQGLK